MTSTLPAWVSITAPGIQTWHTVRAAGGRRRGPCGDHAFALRLRTGRTAVVLIDVAGHGPACGPTSSALGELISSSLDRDASPAVALGCADAWLRTSDAKVPYAVAFVGVFHPTHQTVVYASAGHDCAFVLNDDGRVQHLAPTTPMLGIPVALYPCDAVLRMEPHETLVLATDGVADSRPAESIDFFGTTGTARAVAQSLRAGGNPALDLLASARAHAGGRQVDDAGIMIARIAPL
jgi:serine phosphatase RsbU (regulator of sigma subunit)